MADGRSRNGGARTGSGRRKGVKAPSTLERMMIVSEPDRDRLADMIGVASDTVIEPTEIIQAAMMQAWNIGDIPQAVKYAEKLMPYTKARLTSVENKTTVTNRYERMSDEQLLELAGTTTGLSRPATITILPSPDGPKGPDGE
jgi:hypothetical protein